MSRKIQRALILGLISVGVLIVGFFGLRAVFAFKELRRHSPPPLAESLGDKRIETDVGLMRDWMTIPYISKTYQVDPKLLFDVLNLSPRENQEKSLLQLNEEFFPDAPGIVLELIKAAIRANKLVPPRP